jgi:hypothetical protein
MGLTVVTSFEPGFAFDNEKGLAVIFILAK